MTTAVSPVLSADQVAQYHAQGYLVVPNLLSDAEIEAFIAHDQEPRPAGWLPSLRHHVDDPQFRHLAQHPRIAGGAGQLLGGRPWIVQTMYLKKAPSGKGIALHQDAHYLRNEPNTLMACWLAFDDADEGNGTLCVVPGSHRGGLRKARKNQDDAEHDAWETEYDMRDKAGRTWKEKYFSFQIEDLDMSTVTRLVVPRGAGVFFIGMTIHGSFANHSPTRQRRAFAVHYVKEGTWLDRQDVQEIVRVE